MDREQIHLRELARLDTLLALKAERDLARMQVPITIGPGSKRKPGGVIELPYLDGVQHANFPKETP